MYENSLRLYKFDGANWDLVQNSSVNTTTNEVTASISSPGRFVVMGDPIPEGDRLDIVLQNISFGSYQLTGLESEIEITTGTWTILDATYATKSWDVKIRATDFIDSSLNEIPVSNMKLVIPEVFVDVGTLAPTIHMTEPTSLTGLDQILLSSPGNTTGLFHFSPVVKLKIPAQTYKGTYTNLITVTISAGP